MKTTKDEYIFLCGIQVFGNSLRSVEDYSIEEQKSDGDDHVKEIETEIEYENSKQDDDGKQSP